MATLLEMTLTGGVLILLVLLLRAIFLNRLPKTAFIVMWAVVLLRLLVPVSFFGTTAAETASEAPEVYTLEAVTPTEETEVREVITLNSYNPSTEPTAETAERADLFGIIWLIGAVVCAVVLVLSYILSIRRFNRSENLESDFISAFQSSNKLRRTVTVKLSDKTTTPLTYGIIHSVILLPMSMDLSDQKQLKYVLMHEYIHIRKLDNLLKGISSAAVCIHWFNPLVWVMNKFLSRDIELRCDEALLRQCSGDCRADYALTLIDLEDQRRGYAPATTAFAMRTSEERIVAIMKYRKLTPSSVLAMILCITLLCTALVGCGAVSTTEQTTEASTTTEATTETEVEETADDEANITDIGESSALKISINNLISTRTDDSEFSGIEHTDTLPDGMYFSDGVLYNADGNNVGKLKDGDECMVIDGTGQAAEGYEFIIVDIEVSASDAQEIEDSTDESTVLSSEEPSEESETENSYTFYLDSYTSYYPIYETISMTKYYSNSGETVSDSESAEVDVDTEGVTYSLHTYVASDHDTVNISMIYLVPEDEEDVYLLLR
ncbi:MAG: M56 family metallopeptidase [Oscillospiraceae bacterium]|nr:M56 family metallopeptidase [Oscillospiraceae bacterium]